MIFVRLAADLFLRQIEKKRRERIWCAFPSTLDNFLGSGDRCKNRYYYHRDDETRMPSPLREIGAVVQGNNNCKTKTRARRRPRKGVRASARSRSFFPSPLTSSHCEPRVKMLLDSRDSLGGPSLQADPGPRLASPPLLRAASRETRTHTRMRVRRCGGGPCLTLRSLRKSLSKIPSGPGLARP